jgi:hypothetical protein
MKRSFGTACLPLAALMVLAACDGTVATGTVAGTLERVGGPAPTHVPLPGRVVAVASTGARFTVSVGNSGRFKLSVPPGSYHLTGYSPQVLSDGAEMQCSARNAVRVKAGNVSPNVHVVCPIR